ncbi:IclR family transcriptional regulator [Polymorphobacter sp.]|uniref:IclR family transcriptional regulator n=1 Tax=Polymorphobacter sp. TaxID=1909290 RepID=UPI003F72A8A7
MSTPRIQSVDRAFALLQQLSEPGATCSLPVMAARSGLSVATAHRLLTTLEAVGAVIRIAPGGYRIGMGLHALTRGSNCDDVLAAALQPVLNKLARSLGLVVHAGVWDADQMVTYIAKQVPRHALSIPTRIGSQLEGYCSGMGKVLLAHLPDDAREAYLGGEPFVMLSPNTVTDPEVLRAELAQVRARGWAIDDGEIYVGLRCVAVPLFDAEGGAMAAISCSGSTDVVTWEAVPRLFEALREASEAVRAKLFPASRLRVQ